MLVILPSPKKPAKKDSAKWQACFVLLQNPKKSTPAITVA